MGHLIRNGACWNVFASRCVFFFNTFLKSRTFCDLLLSTTFCILDTKYMIQKCTMNSLFSLYLALTFWINASISLLYTRLVWRNYIAYGTSCSRGPRKRACVSCRPRNWSSTCVSVRMPWTGLLTRLDLYLQNVTEKWLLKNIASVANKCFIYFCV